MHDIQHISEKDIQSHLSMGHIIGVMEQVFKHPEKGQMPPKIYLELENDNDFRAMPAKFGDAVGIKWASIFPANEKNKFGPSVSATIMLNYMDTGYPIAMMDGMLITSYRTAAVTGVATKHLAKDDAKTAAFVGCGFQTAYQIEAILNVRNIRHIKLFDLDRTKCEHLAAIFGKTVIACETLEECVRGSDILTTLTPSRKPLIKLEWLEPGMHINAIGADAEGKQEFEDNLGDVCQICVVDDKAQAFHSGESQHTKNKEHFINLSTVVNPHFKQRVSMLDSDISFFDSTGLATEDIAVASYIYKNLTSRK